jgi:hypothetical protein
VERLKNSLCLFAPLMSSFIALNANADFASDSKLNLKVRNVYHNMDFRDRSYGTSMSEEWAQGFRLDFESGYTQGALGFGLDAMGLMGVTLDSGRGRHIANSMIPSDGDRAADEWSRLGLTLKMKASATEARVGTLLPSLPILVANDGRLLPQTFQGGMVTSKEIDGLTLIGGKITQATGRGSTDRTGLAVAGGREDSNAFYFAGLDYKVGPDVLLQYYQSSLEDYYRQQFGGAVYNWKLAENHSLKTDLRYFRTRGQGANASGDAGYRVGGFTHNGDGEIDNDTWSATFIYSTSGHSFLLGYQEVSDNSNFVQPNQGSLPNDGAAGTSIYLYTDRLAASFNRAGQNTRYAQYSYNFAALGVPGLNASVMMLDSDGIKTASRGNQGEGERDIILSYAVQSGSLKGLGVTWLNGSLKSDVDSDMVLNRVIFNYTIPIF